jgi:hypothetical protein
MDLSSDSFRSRVRPDKLRGLILRYCIGRRGQGIRGCAQGVRRVACFNRPVSKSYHFIVLIPHSYLIRTFRAV